VPVRALTIALAIAILAFVPFSLKAQSIDAFWNEVTLDINDMPEQIAGYHIHYGNTDGGPYPLGFSTGNQLFTTVNDLNNGDTYYFVVTAIDVAQNESAPSNQASYVVPYEDCNNLADDDFDGLTDCQDTECPNNPEECDGFDNDCDTQIDNLTGPDCPLQSGVCQGSTQPCGGSQGWLACDAGTYGSDYESTEASCDALDNDCDNETDEDLVGPLCALQLGVCENSRRPCLGASGFGTCDASVYGSDYEANESRCDGLDNDCDGQTDSNLTGPDCALQDGVCAGSTQPCGGASGWQPCVQSSYGGDYEVVESSCDGLDNDCDQQTDEDLTGPPCTLQLGVCAGSTRSCGGAAGWLACDNNSYGADYEATETLCDDLDNDCDGNTDEDCPCSEGETQDCSTDEGECEAGTQTCDQNGVWGACSGILPGTEDCDGLDNNCDTQTDEDLTGEACLLQDGVCQGSTRPCAGVQGWQPCDASTYGSDYQVDEDLCDGLDNDCDDQTDEDLGGPPCPFQLGVCAGSTRPCTGNGGWGDCDAFVYGNDYENTETLCDGLDNDCDDQTDEDLDAPACPLQVGVCAGSLSHCGGNAGWLACDATTYGNDYEAEETRCDGLDNDCDDQTDEGNVCSQEDGGMDAGLDAGPDAGTDAGTDAGADAMQADEDPGPDGGSPGLPRIEGGCSCANTQGGGAPLLFLLSLILIRRKRF
jgi:hypothetical protein